MYDKLTKTGGLVDHLNTSDTRKVVEMIKNGNKYAKLIYDAMIYEIGKTAGAMAASLLKGRCNYLYRGNISRRIRGRSIKKNDFIHSTNRGNSRRI